MRARLFCKTGQLAGAIYQIAHEATIGKGAENSIQLYPALISGRHARISYDGKAGSYFLEDLGSRNGTRLDGMRVTRKERLGRLHIITFANAFDFIFQCVEEDVTSASEVMEKPPQPVAKESRRTEVAGDFDVMPVLKKQEENREVQPAGNKTMVDDAVVPLPSIPAEHPASQSAGEYYLEFRNVKGGQQAFKLHQGENVVGRDPACQIAIDDASLSRKHGALNVRGAKVTIKDLESKNHTFVGEAKITGEVEIRSGDEIAFGLVKAVLVQKR